MRRRIGRDHAEGHLLAARRDGRHDLGHRARDQDEHDARGRLLDRLEQGVGRRPAQKPHVAQDVDLRLRAYGSEWHVLDQRTDLGYQVARGRLRRIHMNIGMGAVVHAHPLVHVPWLVLPRDHALGQHASRLGLARTGRSHKEIGVGEPALVHGSGEGLLHARLARQTLERLRNPFYVCHTPHLPPSAASSFRTQSL